MNRFGVQYCFLALSLWQARCWRYASSNRPGYLSWKRSDIFTQRDGGMP